MFLLLMYIFNKRKLLMTQPSISSPAKGGLAVVLHVVHTLALVLGPLTLAAGWSWPVLPRALLQGQGWLFLCAFLPLSLLAPLDPRV